MKKGSVAPLIVSRVATVREKSGYSVDGHGNLERTWNIREKSGNLKTNGLGRKFINTVQKGKGCTFSRGSLSPFPSSLWAILKGKNLLPKGANSFL